MFSSRSAKSAVLALTIILGCLLIPANSRSFGLSRYRNTNYASNEISENNHGSLNKLSKSDVEQTDRNHEAQHIQSVYRINFIDVIYHAGLEELQVPEKFEVNDISTDDLTTKKPPVNISVDRIINTPRRKCPGGQKLDTFGTCQTVWKS
ncbi:hypothetical protein L798_14952 [Zootermopsis nevadensis]|uniref:Uncharacterized protein n=1 Tax=Zootermopsis nevadensis TaxID=136037 RepID=A0A067QRI5_ZOONE|nr:hypothetical protein L798_14952 [Zootermopsis nevadensis]